MSVLSAIFDDASLSALERIRLTAQLSKANAALYGAATPLQKIKAASQVNALLIRLGVTGKRPDDQQTEVSTSDEQQGATVSASKFYEFDPDRKPAQRKKDNRAAMDLLTKIDIGEIDPESLTTEHKLILAKYSGTGGALIGSDGKKGSAYEYYTPKPIAEGMWDLMRELGFSGGKVLDPSAGVGIFSGVAPEDAAIDAVELNETSGRINGLVNNGPGRKTVVSPFEKVAANTPDEEYDAVITNVPFGEIADRGGNQLHDNKYQKEPLQNYFILRSLEKLKPGGLACFITPPRVVSGKGGKEEELRLKSSFMAEFLGAYRLPNSVFGTASADTITDMIAFRKFNKDTLEKISELREQSPSTLIDANINWQPFIEGKYFDSSEGKRFILGEFVPKDPNKFRDADRVINPASVTEIGKMLRKFPDSRINWDLLDSTETLPIIYRDGDTITQAGQTLQMKDGRWVAIKRNEDNSDMLDMGHKLSTPYSAFESKVTYKSVDAYLEYMRETSQMLDVPDWVRGAMAQILGLSDLSDRAKYWNAGVIGLAVAQVLDERLGDEVGVNYLDEYPALSDAMQAVSSVARSRPAMLGGKIKDGLNLIGVHYQKAKGFSAIWRGDVQQTVTSVEVTADSGFEGLRYKSKSIWVTLDDAKGVFGDDFNPIEDPAWCVSPDGKSVTRADDYYVGNYAEFLKRVDGEIAAATDETVKAKLLRQKLDAQNRIDKIDVTKLTFNLFSPYVTHEEKAEFMRRFVHPSAAVVFDEKTGRKRVDIDVRGSNLSDRAKLLNRIGDYMKNGTITLGGAKLDMPDEQALKELRKMVNTANEQFNGWVRGNKVIIDRLNDISSDPEKLRFRQVDDESAVPIPGMSGDITLHGYQNSFVRQQSRGFGGINGFGVGLGKTFTALSAVQYVQSIEVKKKTLFVVPNSVLSNWRKEASRAYASMDDLLFIGLRVNKNGDATVKSSNFDADLTSVMENRHSKIFMTLEAFERIRLKDETIADYEAFLRRVDSSFSEKEDKKADERAKGKQSGLMAILTGKTGSAPYLEDMGVDSIVIDESHVYKNSSETIDFKGAKFLSLSPASKRGVDAQAKAWYIRGKSPLKDGVLMLTATPITNSPLEIYSMLSLATGHDRINDICLGVRGADDFMNIFVQKENQDDVTMDGVMRTTDVFVGLGNLDILRSAIGEVATIKSAADVGGQIIVPDREERASKVTLTGDIVDRLKLYKSAFRFAIDDLTNKSPNRGSREAFDAVSDHFGEPIDLIGHPFNLINKMTLLIADPELDQRGTFYNFSPTQEDKAKSVIEQFNNKKIVEERARKGPLTDDSSIIGKKIVKNNGDETELLKIAVKAKLVNGRIVIDTIDPASQTAFETFADKAGLDLDVSVPPKLASMLENFQHEQATPRGVDKEGNTSSIVKQIIFCDILPLHNKIKRLLIKRAGVPTGSIAIITGKTNNSPDEILEVQDGFNANGEDNKYRTVIANEKAEVGINLQIGTQAIHHLTIGWTPDSLEQRNGRGVRQGNKTQRVNIYHYDADGTFDTNKRSMVDKKADWIGGVMDSNGGENISIAGGLSKEQLEALIDTVGDADAMTRLQESVAAKEAEARATTNRDKQMINIDTIRKQRVFLAENESAKSMIVNKLMGLWKLKAQARVLESRIGNPKASESAVMKNQQLLSELNARIEGISSLIDKSANITMGYGNVEPVNVDGMFDQVYSARSQRESDVEEMFKGKRHPSFNIEPIEGSKIWIEWQEEVDMANSMIEESVANFTRQSAEIGGYSAVVSRLISEGKGTVLDGKPVVHGTFSRINDGALGAIFGVLYMNSRGVIHAYAALSDKSEITSANVSAFMSGELIYPGSAEYDQCITDAAEIEDGINSKGKVENRFNEIVPEVAQRRKTEAIAEYSAYNYLLPQPHFPTVIVEANSEVKKHIMESQKAVIKSIDGSNFIVSASLNVQRKTDGYNFRTAIIEYAKANHLVLVADDLSGFNWAALEIQNRIDDDGLKSVLTGSTEQDIRDQVSLYVKNIVAPWFDFGDANIVDYLSWSQKRILKEALSRVASDPDTPVDVSVSGSPDEWVAVQSEYSFTKVVSIREFADEMGEKAAWISKTGAKPWDKEIAQNLPDAPTNSWVIKRKVFDALVIEYPDSIEKHSVRIAA